MADRNEVAKNLEILIDKAREEYFDLVDLTVDDAVELLAVLKEQAEEIKKLHTQLDEAMLWR